MAAPSMRPWNLARPRGGGSSIAPCRSAPAHDRPIDTDSQRRPALQDVRLTTGSDDKGSRAARNLCERNHRRSEEHTSELQSLMRISSAVFCLKKKKHTHITKIET